MGRSSGRSLWAWHCGRWQGRRAVVTVSAPLVIGGGAWYVLHEMQQDTFALAVIGVALIVALVLLALALRGRWHTIRRNDAADLAIIMVTMVLPFMAAFLHVFTGGDPQVFANSADYTTQEMIIRLSIFVAICVLASIGLGPIGSGGGRRRNGAWHRRLAHWATLMGFFWLVQVLFYTTFLTNVPNGLATGS